jgi:hypothetical protein
MLARTLVIFALVVVACNAFYINNTRVTRSSLNMGLHDHELATLDGRFAS